MKKIHITKRNRITVLTVILCIIIAIILLNVLPNLDLNFFITNDETGIKTSAVTSYTIVNENNESKTYYQGDDKFNEISDILSSVEIKRDKNEIYLYDDEEQIILKNKNKSITFYPTYSHDDNDQAVILIIKDFCENKGTTYLLDHHKYLIGKISKDEYNKIFTMRQE